MSTVRLARVTRLARRVVLILVIAVGVGTWTSHALIRRAVAHGTPEYRVRLAGATGGLFAGGASAVFVALAFLLGTRPKSMAGESS